MAKSSTNIVVMALMLAVSMLIPIVVSQITPSPPFIQIPGLFPPIEGAEKCWESLTNIPGCLMEINDSLSKGQIGKIGRFCCNAINQINDNCWPKMFPMNPFFPSLLKNFCAAPSPQTAAGRNLPSKITFPQVLINETEITECWKSVTHTEGCASEISKSFTSGKIPSGIGSACCKVITEISDKCWPKMFPFNPFFPPFLKTTCAEVTGVTPPPKAV